MTPPDSSTVRVALSLAPLMLIWEIVATGTLLTTLPLKEKQIQQTRLESEARKEATVKNAEALAQAKVIDSKAELEKRKYTTEADADRIRRVAVADSERMRLEADVLKTSPLLIQKINPTQLFPQPNAAVRAFATSPHSVAQGYTELTPTEFYKLILAADMGVNYYARENDPMSSQY